MLNILYHISLTWILTYIQDLHYYMIQHQLVNNILDHGLVISVMLQKKLHKNQYKVEGLCKLVLYNLADLQYKTLFMTLQVINILSEIIYDDNNVTEKYDPTRFQKQEYAFAKVSLLNRHIETILETIDYK